MLNIFLCDDNKYDIEKIKSLIHFFSKKNDIEFNITDFSNPNLLIYDLDEGKIADIFILDVEMPEMNGFELAEKIRDKSETAVIIFLTSHNELAHKGYKSKALRYVIKMNLEKDMEEALESAVAELRKTDTKTVTLHRYNDFRNIPYKDIMYVSKVSRQLVIATSSFGEMADSNGIKELFESLNDRRFLFIDRSCFVNIDYISQLNGYTLKLKNGQELPISRRSLQIVKRALMEYWGNK